MPQEHVLAEKPHDSLTLVTLTAEALGVIVPALYVIGFVAVNIQYLQFGSPPLALLSPRYLSASLLFLALTLPAALVGSLATYDDSAIAAAVTPGDLRKLTARVMLTLLMAPFTSALLAVMLNLIAGLPFRWDSPLAAAVLGWIVAKSARHHLPVVRRLWTMRARGKAQAQFRRALLGPALLFSGLQIILLAGIYGVKVYPMISPAFGGGSSWMVTISVSSESPLYPTLDGALIDQTDATLLVAICVDSSRGRMRGVLLPAGRVEAVRFHNLVSLSTRSGGCPTPDMSH